jgi:hypothetical protein
MTVKELMELTGETRFNYVKVLINDALNEIQLITNENVTQYTTTLEEGVSKYSLPSNLVQVKDIKIKDTETGYYNPIPRIHIKEYKEK